MQTPQITGKETIGSGNWLRLNNIYYTDPDGKERVWEAAERTTNGAVGMFAWLRPSNRLILVRQFRVPVNAYVIECPAGLIDPNEDPQVTAIRELYEETGYHGTINKIFPNSVSSPGLSSEGIQLLTMEVDELATANQDPQPQLEESEFIETVLVKAEELMDYITARVEAGDLVDSKVLVYAAAISGAC